MGFIDTLPRFQNGMNGHEQAAVLEERGRLVVEAVKAGKGDATWMPFNIAGRGHRLTVWMLQDMLRIENTRVNVSATTQQQVADLLGACFLTPFLSDALYSLADVRILPRTQLITDSVDGMVSHSQAVDRAIGSQQGSVADCGKLWVLVNALLADGHSGGAPGMLAANYGWHVPTNPWGGIHCDRTATNDGWIIQSIGTRHSRYHVDYSQCCRLVLRSCVLDGAREDIRAIMQSPDMSFLVSHEGPLVPVRQPGVDELDPITYTPATGPVSQANTQLGVPVRHVV